MGDDIKKYAFSSLRGAAATVLGIVSASVGLHEQLVSSGVIERVVASGGIPGWVWWLAGYCGIWVGGFLGYRRVREERDEARDLLQEEFEVRRRGLLEYRNDEYRGALDRFTHTLDELLFRYVSDEAGAKRKHAYSWKRFLPDDLRQRKAFYRGFAQYVMGDIGGHFEDVEDAFQFKEQYRTICQMFDRCYQFKKDFPDRAEDVFKSEIKEQQKNVLYLLTYLGNPLHQSTYINTGFSDEAQPRWLQLWNDWMNTDLRL